ncbi:unnamed protein product, partial [Symbiodinium sp. KB8]
EAKAPIRTQSAPPSARRRAESRGPGGQWNTPLLLPQEAVPPPAARGPARAETEEDAAVFGLSTTVANERLVEQIEAVVGEFLELVKASVVTWRARLSFLQTQEGAIAPLVVLALVVFAVGVLVLTGDTWLVGEVLLILPFHLLAWYISFRLPRAEKLRAIAKEGCSRASNLKARANGKSSTSSKPPCNPRKDGTMLARMPMDGKVLEAALRPWVRFEENRQIKSLDFLHGPAVEKEAPLFFQAQPAQPSEAVVGAEANMIWEILRFSQVVASDEEIRLTFSRTDKEAYLAEALLAGGMTGSLDAMRMFRALRAATSAGSTWAPLWLGDVERLQLEGSCAAREEDSGAVARCCRRWYLEAGARGHPDAEQRLASVQ